MSAPHAVTAVDPSPGFVEAARERNPERRRSASGGGELPFDDDSFDAALAQLVVHFMADPVAGLAPDATRDAARRRRRGMRLGSRRTVRAARAILGGGARARPGGEGQSGLPGAREGDLERLFLEAGLGGVEEHLLTVEVEHPTFEEWWEPFTLGVGPAGSYVAGLTPESRDRLRERCRELRRRAVRRHRRRVGGARGCLRRAGRSPQASSDGTPRADARARSTTLAADGARGRDRRATEQRQDDAVQRADPRGRGDHGVRVGDRQAERRHGDDRRRAPRPARRRSSTRRR